MMGLYLLILVSVWLAVSVVLAIFVAKKLPIGGWRILVGVLLVLVVFPVPLIDEIVGGIQFRQLCEENSAIQIDRERAKGRTVYLAPVRKQDVRGTWVHVVLSEWRFVDVNTGETVVSYNTLNAGPGFFHLSGAPLIFKGSCAPANRPASVETFRTLGISYVERPTTGKGN